jgi:hypothetical protein
MGVPKAKPIAQTILIRITKAGFVVKAHIIAKQSFSDWQYAADSCKYV